MNGRPTLPSLRSPRTAGEPIAGRAIRGWTRILTEFEESDRLPAVIRERLDGLLG